MAGRDHQTLQLVRRLPRTWANPHIGFRRHRAARTCASANAAGSRSTRMRPSRPSGSRGAHPAVFMPVTGVGSARPVPVPAARPRSLPPSAAHPGANVRRVEGARIGARRSSLELSSSHSPDSPSASDWRSVRPEALRVSSDRRPPRRTPPRVASRRDNRPSRTSPPSRPRRPSGRALRSPNRAVGPSPPHQAVARPRRRVSPRLRPRRRQARLLGQSHDRRLAFWRRHSLSGSTGIRWRASGAMQVSRGQSRPCLALGTT